MPEDLPIYPDAPLRTGLQFAGLERLKTPAVSEVWQKSDDLIALLEGASGVRGARDALSMVSTPSVLRLHSALFSSKTGAGRLRSSDLKPLYRGQDCAPPQFIERSLDNMGDWLAAESFQQIHPVEQCALTIARIVDIWPFDFGNLTVAIVSGNSFLEKAALAPFFVLPEHRHELEKVIAQAMTIDMQPLINAIHATVKKEMEALASR